MSDGCGFSNGTWGTPATLPPYATLGCALRHVGQLVNCPGDLSRCPEQEQLVPLQNAFASSDTKSPDAWVRRSQWGEEQAFALTQSVLCVMRTLVLVKGGCPKVKGSLVMSSSESCDSDGSADGEWLEKEVTGCWKPPEGLRDEDEGPEG